MKNRIKLFSNRYIRYGLVAIGGVFVGWLFFHTPKKVKEGQQNMEQTARVQTTDSTGNIEPGAVRLTREAAELADVQTTVVTRGKPVKEVRLYGKVEADERSIQSQTSHLPGRIEKLLINFTGETVRKGQPLVIIYSPELVTAQQELLEAAKTKSAQPGIYEAAKERLRLWKLTDSQVEEIENSGRVKDNFEIVSNTDGVITDLRVNTGDHVDQGTVLFDVANLSDVWVMFDAYEKDLFFLKNGDRLSFTVQALPGVNFAGKITFIDPVINPDTRVANVRVEVNNSSGRLKPGMFATGIVRADLRQYAGKMIIPRSSVLWTGVRSIVYVKQPGINEPVFNMRQIELGPSLVDSYIVLSGLNEGEKIVTNGTFSVDASAQLQSKPNMMNPQGGKVNTMPGMNMPGMNMPGMKMPEGSVNSSANTAAQGKISMDFIMQLNDVYDQYILLKNALIESDVSKARQASEKVRDALNKVDMKLLSGNAHTKWMDILNILNEKVNIISSSGKIDEDRTAFSGLSDQMYKAIKTFGLMGRTVYYQFCPMFNNGKGAYWLSETKDIRNPYYGKKMIDCGETKETLNY